MRDAKRTVFTVTIKEGDVPVRKRLAPPARPMPSKAHRKPRHKPEYIDED